MYQRIWCVFGSGYFVYVYYFVGVFFDMYEYVFVSFGKYYCVIEYCVSNDGY